MRLQVASDWHFECQADDGKSFVESLDPSKCDVLVLAGDLCPVTDGLYNSLVMICRRFKDAQVLYVPGNHDYWRSDRGTVNAALRKAKDRNANLHLFNREVLTLGGKRFLGATLWFPRSRRTEEQASGWSDFLTIPGFFKWVYEANRMDCLYFRKELQEGDIVITHHLPSWLCVDPKYAADSTNCFYVCDLEDLILERKPALWIHGHTHVSGDHMIGSTRILCNPFGYAVENMMNPRYQEELVIEV